VTDAPEHSHLADAIGAINRAWLAGRVDDLAPALHPEIVMALPGFGGQVRGREPFLAGFRDFVENATLEDYREHDQQVDLIGGTGVVTFTYEMRYARGGERYRVTGRDLWVFQQQGTRWIAVWRTMMDLNETRL
jgi:hypothetical protein